MIDITKTFLNGKVIANDKVNLRVKENEVHAIIGENGAGKSTLMSMLFGIYSPDSGIIKINGNQVNFSSAKDASDIGLGMVHQHFKLIDEFTVWENIILGNEGTSRLKLINQRRIKQEIQNLINLYGFKLDVNKKVSDLTVGQQQKIEILKLLYRKADILIFDEPTAVLSQDEIEAFFDMIRQFKNLGKTIIIITHKLAEIKSIADSGTVIRRGKYIDSFAIKDRTIDQIAELMVGHKLLEIKNQHHDISNNEIKFSVENLPVAKYLKSQTKTSLFNKLTKKLFNPDKNCSKENSKKKHSQNEYPTISFNIKAGEIFAISGVEGNGQSELALMLMGLINAPGATIKLMNKNLSNMSIKKRLRSGISSIPEDRHKYGLVLDMPVNKNAVLNEIDMNPYSKFGFLRQSQINKKGIDIIHKYDVRGTTRGTTMSRLLSGGNQQKLIIGREMQREHELLILVQPTRGMDLGAIQFIHEQILKERDAGKAILLISYELDEILTLANTIAVIQNGRFLDVGSYKTMTRSRIGQLMAGKQ
ncbi:MAG: ABC transporter ATP-binding protein [Ureaplasma sp.]|nr:ABC transporter ATP-binding protein [Ureaplasma sp.]